MIACELEAVRIGAPVAEGGLRVYPLFRRDDADAVTYGSVTQALQTTRARVTEPTDAEPWYRWLNVHNDDGRPLLVRDSDVLVGGKQDRLVDVTCVVPSRAVTRIPVSCVERGRSSYRETSRCRSLEASQTSAPADLRSRRLGQTMLMGRPDQSDTWRSVADHRTRSGLQGGDGSLGEALAASESAAALEETVMRLSPIEGAHGLLVARRTGRGERLAVAELHASAAVCADIWTSLIRSVATGSSISHPTPPHVQDLQDSDVSHAARAAHVSLMLDLFAALADWTPLDAPGVGTSARGAADDVQGTAVSMDGTFVSLSLICA